MYVNLFVPCCWLSLAYFVGVGYTKASRQEKILDVRAQWGEHSGAEADRQLVRKAAEALLCCGGIVLGFVA